jgi:hypothetical protein
MRAPLRLLPLLLTVALAGCGQAQSSADDFEGAEKAVADKVEELQTAAQNRKPEDICSEVLARSLVERLRTTDGDCVDEMEKIAGDADDFELDVTDVAITGTRATARVEAQRGDRDDAVTSFAFAREDGEWRLTDLGSS